MITCKDHEWLKCILMACHLSRPIQQLFNFSKHPFIYDVMCWHY